MQKSEAGVRVNESVVKSLELIETKAQEVDGGLQQILSRISQVDQNVAQIAASCIEQTQGVTQIGLALTQMDQVTQSNAANSEETASAATQLNTQSQDLKSIINELIIMVEGAARASSTNEGNAMSFQSAAAPKKLKATPKKMLMSNSGG